MEGECLDSFLKTSHAYWLLSIWKVRISTQLYTSFCSLLLSRFSSDLCAWRREGRTAHGTLKAVSHRVLKTQIRLTSDRLWALLEPWWSFLYSAKLQEGWRAPGSMMCFMWLWLVVVSNIDQLPIMICVGLLLSFVLLRLCPGSQLSNSD